MKNKLAYLTSFLTLAAIFLLASCSDDNTHKFYRVYNAEDGGKVPYYASGLDGGEPAGYLDPRTDIELFDSPKNDEEALHMAHLTGSDDTIWVRGKNLFVRKVEGEVTPEDCYFVQTEGKAVPIYESAEGAATTFAISGDTWVKERLDTVKERTQILFFDGTTGWIDTERLGHKTRDLWTPKKTRMEELRGRNEYMDKVLDFVAERQETDQHYATSTFWIKFKIAGVFILFAIAAFFMFYHWDEKDGPKRGRRQKWLWSLPVIATGLWLMYYEYVDAVVLGDGYFKAIPITPFDIDFGWFVNLLILLFVGILYLLAKLVVLFIFLLGQLFVVPLMGYAITGPSKRSATANLSVAAIIYIGSLIAYFAGPEHMSGIILTTLCLSSILTVWCLTIGLTTRNWQSILALSLPTLYAVSVVTAFFAAQEIFSTILSISALLLILVGLSSLGGGGLKSQGSGKKTVVKNQAGQTVATHTDSDGWKEY